MNKKKEILKKALNLARGIQSNIEVPKLFPHLLHISMSHENKKLWKKTLAHELS
jgi:hypothetical protein